MKPYYEDGSVTIYHGDCRELLRDIEADVLVTDPPYGIRWDVVGGTFRSRNRMVRGQVHAPVIGDDQPFDPSHLLALGLPTVLFGANHYANSLPPSPSWIVWDKRPSGWSNNQADTELAWSNLGGPARIIRKAWSGGGTMRKENGNHPVAGVASYHPTQKPVDLMCDVIQRCPVGTVLDPYMGAGSTLIAAKLLGRKAIGIEIEERYCEIAARRCSQEVLGLAI